MQGTDSHVDTLRGWAACAGRSDDNGYTSSDTKNNRSKCYVERFSILAEQRVNTSLKTNRKCNRILVEQCYCVDTNARENMVTGITASLSRRIGRN